MNNLTYKVSSIDYLYIAINTISPNVRIIILFVLFYFVLYLKCYLYKVKFIFYYFYFYFYRSTGCHLKKLNVSTEETRNGFRLLIIKTINELDKISQISLYVLGIYNRENNKSISNSC